MDTITFIQTEIMDAQREQIERLENDIRDLSALIVRYIDAYQQSRVDLLTARREISSAEKRIARLNRQLRQVV